MNRLILCAAVASIIGLGLPLHSAFAQAVQRVQFDRGASSTSLRGQIRGYEYRDYLVGARAGQTLSVDLATRHGATYFNILAPGSQDAAMFVGSSSGKAFSGRLPASGDYRIRVYMMRSAARRNEVANYQLSVAAIGGGGRPGYGPGGAGARPPPPSAGMPSRDAQACLQAVTRQSNNPDVVLLREEFSQANTLVIVGVGPQRAPWRCLASGGRVSEVYSLRN